MLIPFALASSPHRALAVRFAAPLLCAISITLPCAGVVAQPAGLEKIQTYRDSAAFKDLLPLRNSLAKFRTYAVEGVPQ